MKPKDTKLHRMIDESSQRRGVTAAATGPRGRLLTATALLVVLGAASVQAAQISLSLTALSQAPLSGYWRLGGWGGSITVSDPANSPQNPVNLYQIVGGAPSSNVFDSTNLNAGANPWTYGTKDSGHYFPLGGYQFEAYVDIHDATGQYVSTVGSGAVTF